MKDIELKQVFNEFVDLINKIENPILNKIAKPVTIEAKIVRYAERSDCV